MSDLSALDTLDYVEALKKEPRTRVRVERPRPEVAIVRLADLDNKNALSGALTVQLQSALTEVAGEPRVRVIVLTGAGRYFSVGGDWRLMTERAHNFATRDDGTADLWRWIRAQFGGIARLITQTDKTVIAAINGDAAGVALAWALNCDLIAAASTARLVTAFGRIGLVPEVGTNWVLTRRIGYARAYELFARGRPLSAVEAVSLGLVNACVAPEDLDARIARWCDEICALPSYVTAMTKPLMRAAADMTFDQAMVAEEFAEPNTFTTRYHQRTIAALVTKSEKALR